MGAHILHDPRVKDLDSPCGLCLSTGGRCTICLTKRNKRYQVDMATSHCPNLYCIQLRSAAKYSAKSPCTNNPLTCPLCPPHSDCVWKYNLRSHILMKHPTANIDLYEHLFKLHADEATLMRGVFLAKPRKLKKKPKPSKVLHVSEAHSSRCKGNLAVLRLITQASKGGSKENI
jgi:hypothetical protein